MARPTTLPEPWRSLAAKLGGVGPLSEAIGVAPRYLNLWALRQRTPSKTAQIAINALFRINKLEPPIMLPIVPPADPLPKPFLPPNIDEISRGVVAKTPNNREVRVRKQGGFEVQPHNDNYWIECATLEDAAAAFLDRSDLTNPANRPVSQTGPWMMKADRG